MPKSICALARMPCPRTADPAAKVYCPHWKDAIPEHEKDGSGRVTLQIYTGCQLPKLIPYLQSMTAELDHTHAAANQARDVTSVLTEKLSASEETLRDVLLTGILSLGARGGTDPDHHTIASGSVPLEARLLTERS